MFLKKLSYYYIRIDDNKGFPTVYSGVLYVISISKLWVFEKSVSNLLSRKMRTKNLAILFKRPYLDNSKTHMFSLLFYLVIFIFQLIK